LTERIHARASALTVRAALALDAMRAGLPEVIAGTESIDRPLRWAHSSEVANIGSFLRGGELLLVTGMGIGDGEREQRRYVRQLIEHGVAGLVIQLGHTFKRVPKPIVEEAVRGGLPLIALNRDVPFVEITEAIHRAIVNRQVALLEHAEEMHRSFTQLMLQGAGVAEVLDELATAIRNPVALDREGYGIVYHSSTAADGDGATAELWESVALGIAPDVEVTSVPIVVRDDQSWGQILALAQKSPIEELDRVAIERAAGLIAIALLLDSQEEAVIGHERGNFLLELLGGTVREHEAVQRARALGYTRPTQWMLPATTHPVGVFAGERSSDASWALVWRDTTRDLAASGTPMIIGIQRAAAEALIVIGLDDERDRARIADRLASAIHGACRRHLGSPAACAVSVGKAARSWTALGPELERTLRASRSGTRKDGGPWYDTSQPDLDRLLWTLRDNTELREFVLERLGPLLEHDREHKLKLVPTLSAYCERNGRITETARVLCLERQSLYARLRRIRTILGIDLDAPDVRLGLSLALRALPHVKR
jgi:purine catabolism regulator